MSRATPAGTAPPRWGASSGASDPIGLATSVSPPGDACGGESPGDGVRVVTSSDPSAVGGDDYDGAALHGPSREPGA